MFLAGLLYFKVYFCSEEVLGQFCSVSVYFLGLAALLDLSDHSRPAPAAAQAKVPAREKSSPVCLHHSLEKHLLWEDRRNVFTYYLQQFNVTVRDI